ncbi:MAG: hypothetical protein ACRDPH_15650 [Marmoricola sp.]
MLLGIGCGLLAALLYGAPAALQAHASRRLPTGPWWRTVSAAVRDRLMLTVLALYLVGALANYAAIQLVPLYLAQAATAFALIFTALASAWLLGEWPFAHQWGALVLVCLGLGVLALAAGPPGRSTGGSDVVVGLYAGLVACGLTGFALRRLRGHPGGVLLGLTAGVCFAGAPVTARLLAAPWWRWHTLAALGLLAGFGLLGFVFSSQSLQRVEVNTANAPLTFAETVVPAILGIVVFGDGVRPGWWWAIVVGLALSMVGTFGVAAIARPLAEVASEKVEL